MAGKKEKEMENIDEEDLSKLSELGPAEKKGGSKKIIFILVPLIAILGGGGFAAYHFLLNKKTEHGTKGKLTQVARKAPGPMIKLEPFLTNLADENQTSYIKVSISLELKAGTDPAEIKQYMPQIRNAVIMILNSKTTQDIKNPSGIVSLRHQIARSLNQVLGEGSVTGVYFNSYLVQ